MKFINAEFLRFIFFGGINTLLGYVIYLVLLLFFAYQIAYTGSYLIGILISYCFNTKFVFKTNYAWGKMLIYPLSYLTQYFLSMFLLYLFVEVVGVSKLFAPIIVMTIVFPISFILSRFIIKFGIQTERQ